MRAAALRLAAAAASLLLAAAQPPCTGALPSPPVSPLTSCFTGTSESGVTAEPLPVGEGADVHFYCGAATFLCNGILTGEGTPCDGLPLGAEIRFYGPFTLESAQSLLATGGAGIYDRAFLCAANDCNSEAGALCSALTPSATPSVAVTPLPCPTALPPPAAEDLTCYQGSVGSIVYPGGSPGIRFCVAVTYTNETTGQATRSVFGADPDTAAGLMQASQLPEYQNIYGQLFVCNTDLCNSPAQTNCLANAPTVVPSASPSPSGSPSGSPSSSASSEAGASSDAGTSSATGSPSAAPVSVSATGSLAPLSGTATGSPAAAPVSASATGSLTPLSGTATGSPSVPASLSGTATGSPSVPASLSGTATSTGSPAASVSASVSGAVTPSPSAAATSPAAPSPSDTASAAATPSPSGSPRADALGAPAPGAPASSQGSAIGGGVGGVAVVLLAAAAAVWYVRARRRSAARSIVSPHSSHSEPPVGGERGKARVNPVGVALQGGGGGAAASSDADI